jgi:hypothetical protein
MSGNLALNALERVKPGAESRDCVWAIADG